jgi:hypothetical protein
LNILSITKGDIYNNALHSKNISNNRILIKEISLFKSAKYGIISCVYLLGEGFDLPRLNGVCIAANMQSETRIVQYLLRPNRLEFENPNKKAYIIIPYIDGEGDRWDVKNNSFDKVRNIIFCMRNVDKHIEQKIILNLGVVSNPDELPEDGDNNISSVVAARDYHFEDKEDELERIKMRLRYSKSLLSGYSEEQEEYNYIREINKSLCITSKKEYNDSESRNCVYKNDTDNYFIQKGVWVSWYHFMGLDTSGFIQSIDEWRIYCRENKIDSLIRYKEESDINPLLPKEPEDFYNEFTNILSELNLNIYKRR